MKLRVIDRLLAALAGVLLVVVAVPPLFDTVFGTNMLTGLGSMAHAGGAGNVLLMLLLSLLLLAVGGLCIHLAVRRRRGKGFVVQTGELGEVSISIRALEGLVSRCVEKHEELHVTSTLLENTRDGLVIRLAANMASGVNIPKAVGTLQKQIKQYVTTCSGVDVYEVKVQVDTTAAKGNPSVFAVPDVLENPDPLPREEETPAEAPAEPKEEKCLHQRLFGDVEEPAIVPMPPVETPVEEETVQEEAPAAETEEAVPAEEEAVEEIAEENVPADELIEAWEQTEEAAAAEENEAELETLCGLSMEADENEELLEEADCVADEASIAELEALDGVDEEPAQEISEDADQQEEQTKQTDEIIDAE